MEYQLIFAEYAAQLFFIRVEFFVLLESRYIPSVVLSIRHLFVLSQLSVSCGRHEERQVSLPVLCVFTVAGPFIF